MAVTVQCTMVAPPNIKIISPYLKPWAMFLCFSSYICFFTTGNKLLFIAKERSNGHSYGKAVSYNMFNVVLVATSYISRNLFVRRSSTHIVYCIDLYLQ